MVIYVIIQMLGTIMCFKRLHLTLNYVSFASIVWLTCLVALPLQMITKNFEDYPEHRLKFFSLLRAIATYCFPALIRLSSQVCVKIFPVL